MACSARPPKSPARRARQGARDHRRSGEVYKVWSAYQTDVIEAHKTTTLRFAATRENRGRVTTIEKSARQIEKIGRECRYSTCGAA